MSERCIVRVRWDPATSPADVRRTVGGFLRYIQHRDLHPDSAGVPGAPRVAGLLRYVAYRDRATNRAELFVPEGVADSEQRKRFAEYVARSIADSAPQLYRSHDGRMLDRRRAVSRFVISPEHADGLDLERLLRAGVSRLESEMGVSGLRWIAAVHRNTKHHHVHLVLAGLHRRQDGSYQRLDISKRRLAAVKEAVIQEIERQRAPRGVAERLAPTGQVVGGIPDIKPALQPLAFAPRLIRTPPTTRPAARSRLRPRSHRPNGDGLSGAVLRLRTAARRYQRRMQHDAEDEAWRLRWEHWR